MSSNLSQDILNAATDITLSLNDVNLNNCDREPIHIPNLIQPHGVLLALSAEYKIVQVSLNTKSILGIEAQELLDQPLSALLSEPQIAKVRQCLAEDFNGINPLPIQICRPDSVLELDAIVHHNGTVIILELEPQLTSTLENGEAQPKQANGFVNFYQQVKQPINRLQNTHNLDELCTAIVREIGRLTGFDRVMVYRFDHDGAGTVVAEAALAEAEPFLGLRYPATDIPRQAKHLYTLKSLRLIPDAAYEPVGLTPQLNPLTDKPLNLSMSNLRSVSPLHTEYLDNMGVAASMSISLMQEQQLWGLIACHHNTPKRVSYQVRAVCELIGQLASFELVAKEQNQDRAYKLKLKSIQAEFVEAISQANSLEAGLIQNPQQLLELVGADGVALVNEKITLVGKTPSQEAVEAMLPWLTTQFEDKVIYHTNSLAQVYAAGDADAQTASGLLALLISRAQSSFILWFRPEIVQTVNWGGNPSKALQVDESGALRMSPRKSFAKWQETVQFTSLPWKDCEIEAAIELRSSIVSILLRKADELAQINQELARSNTELDAFAYIASHDLKEPLRGIYNYSSFLLEDYGAVLDTAGVDKLNTLMRLTHRMEDLIDSLLHYSRLGRAELQVDSVDLNDLLKEVLDVLKVSARGKQVEFIIPRPLPTIECDRTQVNELFTNLISNGIKYSQQSAKTIEVGYLDPDSSEKRSPKSSKSGRSIEHTATVFYIRDNGIGIRGKHLDAIFRIFKRLHGQKKYGGGTGAGLTISQKIVQRHGGEIWVESVYNQGSTFYFTLQDNSSK